MKKTIKTKNNSKVYKQVKVQVLAQVFTQVGMLVDKQVGFHLWNLFIIRNHVQDQVWETFHENQREE